MTDNLVGVLSDRVSLAGSRDDSKVLQISLSKGLAESGLIFVGWKSLADARGQVCRVARNRSDNRLWNCSYLL